MTVDASFQERKELLLGMYQENRCQVRHYEAVRSNVVSFTLATAVAISALIADGGLTERDWPLALVLVVIGIYSTVFTRYYFRLISSYEQLSEEFCKELHPLYGMEKPAEPRTLTKIREDATTGYNNKLAQELNTGELFRMYWPITISILAVVVMLVKFFAAKII